MEFLKITIGKHWGKKPISFLLLLQSSSRPQDALNAGEGGAICRTKPVTLPNGLRDPAFPVLLTTPLGPQSSPVPRSETRHLGNHRRSMGVSGASLGLDHCKSTGQSPCRLPGSSLARPALSCRGATSPQRSAEAAAAPTPAGALTRGRRRRVPAPLPTRAPVPPGPEPSPPARLPPRPRRAHLKDLAGAQGVHVRGHEEKDPLCQRARQVSAEVEAGLLPPSHGRPTSSLPHDKASGSKKGGHLALHLLVELPAEIGHEHGHGDGTPGARSPGHTKPPRRSRLPPNHGSSDWPRGQPIAT